MYKGNAINVTRLEADIAHLCFDLQGAPVNKFDRATLGELEQAISVLAQDGSVQGLICSSAKSSFIVGADIAEFTGQFKLPKAELCAWLEQTNHIFTAIEQLPFPTVSVINGHALGGGFEFCLATDYRIASPQALFGFPEVGLGICPGFGGTVRAPRVMDLATAVQWIVSGRQVGAEQALASGALDSIYDAQLLVEAALEQIAQCQQDEAIWKEVRALKCGPVAIDREALVEIVGQAQAVLAKSRDIHNPAPQLVLDALATSVLIPRDDALEIEKNLFADLAQSEVATNLIGLFTNDQWLRQKSRRLGKAGKTVSRAGVLGAGIMGGGIAYQSSLKNVPVLMKDIAQAGLDAGMAEASALLQKQVAKRRIKESAAAMMLAAIHPSLDYSGFDKVDIVVEAVVENSRVKKAVLSEVEPLLGPDAILCSNTSTISITDLASVLQHPERFCGMHFFNPVPLMPLVEVIRGEKSSDAAIATTVAYAQVLGKTPIVVNDCPGFLVNRILFPYFGAFSQLLRDGADFRKVDAAMEAFGWPMGPAYLLDVVGIDTAVHAQAVMAQGFPERMRYDFKSAMDLLFEAGELGQKTGSGFYRYSPGPSGRVEKQVDASIISRIEALQGKQKEFDDEEIVARMMLAMCLETVRCLEDGIVSDPIEADMGLILGLGFPKFRGGALRYIDSMGAQAFCDLAQQYANLGPLFTPTPRLLQMAANGEKFYA